MIGNIIGALIGRAIDRRDGEGGLGGALMGAAGVSVIRRVLPLAVLVGAAFVVKNALQARATGDAA